jgi:phosphoribosylformylglycinamidine (FGAM) synthase PurS component
MFQICVLEPKSSKEKINIMFSKLFQNAVIKNIKIHNILDIIEISKNMEPII